MNDAEQVLRSPERLARLLQECGGTRSAAKRLGVSRGKVLYWRDHWGLRKSGESPKTATTEVAEACLEILRKGPVSVSALSTQLDRGVATVQKLLDQLRADGFHIVERGDVVVLERDLPLAETPTSLPLPASDGHLRLGIISDTHLGSKEQQLSYLKETYQRFEEAGVQEIFHIGDLLDGVDVYRGQHSYQFLHTYDEQIDYAAEYYPRSRTRTKVIGGNHDLAGVRRGDPDPLRLLCSRRDDLEYLGPYSAWPELSFSHLLFYLLHPDGGAPSYAVSYRLQKICESFEGGKKPHVLVVGHWHQMAYLHVRNIHALYPGCFQAQTEFERRRALQPQIGGLVLDVEVGDNGRMHAVTPRFFRYFVPKEHDY